MRTRLLSAIAAMLPVVAAAAQAQFTVSSAAASWPNTSGAGTASLDVQVHFPARTVAGQTIVAQRFGGWPVVVFAHGFGFVGSDYAGIGEHLARAGCIAVMLDTAQWNHVVLEQDLRATFAALNMANAELGGYFEFAFDMERVGVMGHSMGGGVLAQVLQQLPGGTQNNPGYRCGLAVAPVDPGPIAAHVHVPFGIVSGHGDLITPPALHADRYYRELAPSAGLKFHYQLQDAADHMNVVGLLPGPRVVYERTKRIAAGFFGHFLAGDPHGLEPVLGVEGAEAAELRRLETATVTPQLWTDRALTLGRTTRISVSSEGGLTGVLAAATLAATPLPTWIGQLLLDPSTAFPLDGGFIPGQRFDVYVSVPNAPSLVGSGFAVQAAGTTAVVPFQLGSALDLRITP